MADSADTLDRNDLAFWFDRLAATGVPVPRTTIVRAKGALVGENGTTTRAFATLHNKLVEAAEAFGFPVFLRTGHGSGKHEWQDTCWVAERAQMRRNILNLVTWSEMVDMLGLPTGTWVVRERLPLVTTFHAFMGKMPINKERRYFIEGGQVICHHPYWPQESILSADCEDWQERLRLLNDESDEEVRTLTALSERVSSALEGAWSLDWAATTDGGWVAIDMAVAAQSWHWESCPMRERLECPRPPAPGSANYDYLLVRAK